MYHDNIQEDVSQAAAANFNQANFGYRPPMVSIKFDLLIFLPFKTISIEEITSIKTEETISTKTHGVSKTDFERYVIANDAVLRNMQNQGQNLQSQMANLTDMLSKFVTANTASTSGSGTLPGNTVTNPKEDLK
ncbi:hypothetical protein Tco_1033487, partial [Tanacetum coccineum]